MAGGTFTSGSASRTRRRFEGRPLRVVLAADRSDLVHASHAILATEPHVVVAEAALGLGDVGGLARRHEPRVVVLATGSRDPAVVRPIRATRVASPAPAVVLVAGRIDEPYVRLMLEAGARGYVSPDDPDLGRAVRAVGAGGAYFSPEVAGVVRRGYLRRGGLSIHALLDRLTDAECEILRALVRGQTSGEIEADLHLSARAFEHHRRRILEALA